MMTHNEKMGCETLGKLAVMARDARLANRIDDGLSREQFHHYMVGVDYMRSARAFIDAFFAVDFDGTATINIKKGA